MKTTKRFDEAVMKLYNAFHSGALKASNCSMCAVGNICDGEYEWVRAFGHDVHTTDSGKIFNITSFESSIKVLFNKNGYSGFELHNIESKFLKQFIGHSEEEKEAQFKGLCAVVEYLCELDNIPNVMDYTKLFETENEQPKYQLV